MVRFLFVLIAAVACGPGSSEKTKPAGTTSDPVAVCERAGDVCKLDAARLGVCVHPAPDAPPELCEGREPCLVCQSQH